MTPALVDGPVQVFHGDALDVLREMPDESVHCVVTSPPYWGLRDYNEAGQLGLEATPDEYVANMVCLFREVRRVLRSDGTCWLNLGDSYAAGTQGRNEGACESSRLGAPGHTVARTNQAFAQTGKSRRAPDDLKPKDLVMMPARVAMALQADGWYLRSDVIWAKPNPMPESVTDRPTNSHEHVFLLTRSPRYFYDVDAVREDRSDSPGAQAWARIRDPEQNFGKAGTAARAVGMNGHVGGGHDRGMAAGRNLRSVWQIATQPYSEAHFATFPEQLCMAPIKAGTSERGCCPDCGAPWRRVVERGDLHGRTVHDGEGYVLPKYEAARGTNVRARAGSGWTPNFGYEYITTGWEPTCDHCSVGSTPLQPVPCTVLDPFAGSGTTLAVARRLGRRAIGIELSQSYIDTLIRPRISGAALPLLEWLQEVP